MNESQQPDTAPSDAANRHDTRATGLGPKLLRHCVVAFGTMILASVVAWTVADIPAPWPASSVTTSNRGTTGKAAGNSSHWPPAAVLARRGQPATSDSSPRPKQPAPSGVAAPELLRDAVTTALGDQPRTGAQAVLASPASYSEVTGLQQTGRRRRRAREKNLAINPPQLAFTPPPPAVDQVRLPLVTLRSVASKNNLVSVRAGPDLEPATPQRVAAEPEEVWPGQPADAIGRIFPTLAVTPIDLASALQMVDVQNPQFLLAQSRVLEAIAQRKLAAAQFLPNINAGTNYDDHTGNLQQSTGNILSVKRSSLYVGAGANAIAAGTVNIPGVVWNQNLSLVLFEYLRSRQVVTARQFGSQAERNEMGLRVAGRYLDLLEAEGRRSIMLDSYRQASELARLTDAYARTGQGRPADANRALTERLDREALVVVAEGDALAASARLAQLLAVDPAVRLHPTDNWVVPHCFVPAPIPLGQLLAIALLQRPELRERQAVVRQALMSLNGAKLLPFSPTIFVGFSAGDFGGGSNLASQPVGTGFFARGTPLFGSFNTRADFDAMAYWTLRNIGLGNRAQVDAAAARLRSADWERLSQLEQVRLEVANAYALAKSRLAQIETSERAVAAALDSWNEDLIRIRGREGLPIEAVNSLRLYSRARLAYLMAIVEYNRAQFALYVALGQPPADALVREAPLPKPPAPVNPQPLP